MDKKESKGKLRSRFFLSLKEVFLTFFLRLWSIQKLASNISLYPGTAPRWSAIFQCYETMKEQNFLFQIQPL